MKVKKGQIWVSLDPRHKDRGSFVIEELFWETRYYTTSKFARVKNLLSGKESVIRVDRMEGKGNKYKCIDY